MHEAGTLDIALYNTSYLNPTYEHRKRPVLNEETVYVLNMLKDVFRRNFKVPKKDLIFEVCRNYTVAELCEKYINMTDWLIMEARHQIHKEMPRKYADHSHFVDVSQVKTLRHTQFGREALEELVLG